MLRVAHVGVLVPKRGVKCDGVEAVRRGGHSCDRVGDVHVGSCSYPIVIVGGQMAAKEVYSSLMAYRVFASERPEPGDLVRLRITAAPGCRARPGRRQSYVTTLGAALKLHERA